jgi:hypothetical protein
MSNHVLVGKLMVNVLMFPKISHNRFLIPNTSEVIRQVDVLTIRWCRASNNVSIANEVTRSKFVSTIGTPYDGLSIPRTWIEEHSSILRELVTNVKQITRVLVKFVDPRR